MNHSNKFSIELSLDQKLKQYEICHYSDENLLITSYHNQVFVLSHKDGNSYSITLPKAFRDIIGRFRLFRRALRLDKCNVVPVGSNQKNLIIIRFGKVYHYDYASQSLTQTLELQNCRNVLHQSICVLEGLTVFFGEYGDNSARQEVPVYRSLDGGLNWEKVFIFPSGKIKHVHGCYWDPYEKKIWVLTGDFSGENFMIVADRNFKEVEQRGDGTQIWRACNVFFEKNSVAWIMDSQLEDSRLIIYDRSSKKVKKLDTFPGPVWYSKRLTDGYYLAATACEIGPGVKDNYAHIMVSIDLHEWFDIYQFQNDLLPLRYFKNGVIGFADGKQSSKSFYLFGEALKGIDGCVYKCSLIT